MSLLSYRVMQLLPQRLCCTFRGSKPFQWAKFLGRNVSSTVTPAEEFALKEKRRVGKWLLGCSGMVFGSVILAGVTRLTDYDPSMVDWHRMWSRTTGVVFALPAAYFWYRGHFSRKMKGRVVASASLLGIQVLMEIPMVRSGGGCGGKRNSRYEPRVGPIHQALYVATTYFLHTLFLWPALTRLLPPHEMTFTAQFKKARSYARAIKGFAYGTAITGAFIVGLGAGLACNTFPKMADKRIPDDILPKEPTRKNFTDTTTIVQFIHRTMGTSALLAVCGLWWHSRKLSLSPRARLAVNGVITVGLVQVGLGFSSLLFYDPVSLAALHQTGALTLLSVALWLSHEMKTVKRVVK